MRASEQPSGAFWWAGQRGQITAAFTRRGTGASTGPHAGLNLGEHVEDDPQRVRSNRAVVLGELAGLAGLEEARIRPVFMKQVHGAAVRVIGSVSDLADPAPPADAVVTALPDVALFALVADCTPVLLHDADVGIIGAAHAGRPGMLAGVVPATVRAMRGLGARGIEALVGPSVCGRCYEVPEEMRAEAMATEPTSGTRTWHGTAAIDVAGAVVDQLSRLDVEVTWIPGCTKETDDLYSYRRDGLTGRGAGVVLRVGEGSQ